MAPVEFAAHVDRLQMKEDKAQFQTAQLLAMLANCNSTEESRQEAGHPDGYNVMDFMPGAEREPGQLSMKDWVLAMEAGKLSEPTTESEKESIRKLNQRMTTTFTGTQTGQVTQVSR
jgi:hypothetical protein